VDEREGLHAGPPGELGSLHRGGVTGLLGTILLVAAERRLVDEEQRPLRELPGGGAGPGVSTDDESRPPPQRERVPESRADVAHGERPNVDAVEAQLTAAAERRQLELERQRAAAAEEGAYDRFEPARADDPQRRAPPPLSREGKQTAEPEVVVGVQVREQADVDLGRVVPGQEQLPAAALAAVDEQSAAVERDAKRERRPRSRRSRAPVPRKSTTSASGASMATGIALLDDPVADDRLLCPSRFLDQRLALVGQRATAALRADIRITRPFLSAGLAADHDRLAAPLASQALLLPAPGTGDRRLRHRASWSTSNVSQVPVPTSSR